MSFFSSLFGGKSKDQEPEQEPYTDDADLQAAPPVTPGPAAAGAGGLAVAGGDEAEGGALDPVDALTLGPVTMQRVEAYFKAEDYRYEVDEDGDLLTGFDSSPFMIQITGKYNEVLVIRSRWQHTKPLKAHYPLLEALNEWCRDRIFPMCYVSRIDGDQLRVTAEHITDLEQGVTDQQLSTLLSCGISTSLQLYEFLDGKIPDEGQALDDLAELYPAPPEDSE
ncbi:YbjN domain-containing protein [Buchananella felis]|uniref:YbjN domain-containing protein n=1 Tax=Buchananella felis TaxID=3231492 RepID=UPI003526F563